MLEDAPAIVGKIATFLGVELTQAELDRVLELSSYQHMRTIDHKFHQSVGSPLSPPDGKMIRSGKKGNSKELITPAQQRRIDDYCRRNLLDLACDFPYDEYYGKSATE